MRTFLVALVGLWLLACASAPVVPDPSRAQALREELIELGRLDQAVQLDAKVNPLDEHHDERMEAVFRKHAGRMHRVLAEVGWPTTELVGEEAERAAFLIVDHADFDLPLQRRGLELLAPAVARGQAPKEQLALLTDRVRKNEGRPQVYGTQFLAPGEGRARIGPIEDEANVDRRRASVGLPPLDVAIAKHADFERRMLETLMKSSADGGAGSVEPVAR